MTLSRSGISYSIGIKGARVRFAPKGTYVSFGSNGIYYQKKITGSNDTGHLERQRIYDAPAIENHTITSHNIERITDIDSQDFIKELKEKGSKISYYKWFGIVPLCVSVIALIYIFFSSEEFKGPPVATTKTFIVGSGGSHVNIRSAPDRSGTVMGVMQLGNQFELLDDNNPEWYKISFDGQMCFVSKQFSEKRLETIVGEAPVIQGRILYEKYSVWFWVSLAGMLILFFALRPQLRNADNRRMLVEIYYEMDDAIRDVYQQLVHQFSHILECSKVWQYLHSQKTYDYKYSSGASHSVLRKPLLRISKNKTPSKIFKTNVEIPYLGLYNTELFFFPERLIIKRGHEIGAIMYKNVDCYGTTTQFIESGPLPSDAVVLGHTWRYLNKNGTPDRRFANNYQIPICQYAEYSFKSSSGLNERISTSRILVLDKFVQLIKFIGQLQKKMESVNQLQPNGNN